MPVLPLEAWPQTSTAAVALRIWVTMLYPDDEAKREELYAILRSRYVLLGIAEPAFAGPEPVERAELIRLLGALYSARPAPDVLRDARHRELRGSIAGEVLLRIRQFVDQSYPASVNRACHFMVQVAKQTQGRSDTTLLPIRFQNPRLLLERAWAPNKSVAHLWAAHVVQWNGRIEVDETDRFVLPAFQWFVNQEDFLRFLDMAVQFRQFGECYRAPGQKVPILPSADAWCIPGHLPLMNRDRGKFPTFPREWRQALGDYRARDMQ